MYGIAMSVAACLRSDTRVDVAWNLDPELTPRFDPADAVGITPGGGRLGSLLGGALDSRLVEVASSKPTAGRILSIELNDLEAQLIGVEPGTRLRVFCGPADVLPEALWDHLLARGPVIVAATLDADRVVESRLSAEVDESTIAAWRPRPTLVVLGGGPMAAAIGGAGAFMGWNVETSAGPETAIGLVAGLSPIDGVVVMGHDTEAVGRVLQAALASGVGYLGSIGPRSLQEARVDWLAYRGVTDLGRLRGPAGIDIGAKSPEEVAVSVVAEMIAVQNGAPVA
ncbi:MAG: XdhC family protein [Actinomycetota bacterium]